jgi:hypothetical protein
MGQELTSIKTNSPLHSSITASSILKSLYRSPLSNDKNLQFAETIPLAFSLFSSPQAYRTLVMLGGRRHPPTTGSLPLVASRRRTVCPARRRAMAEERPAMPAPMMRKWMGRDAFWRV